MQLPNAHVSVSIYSLTSSFTSYNIISPLNLISLLICNVLCLIFYDITTYMG